MFTGDRIDRVCQGVASLGLLSATGMMLFVYLADKPWGMVWWCLIGYAMFFVAMTIILVRQKRYEKMWQSARKMILRHWSDD